jgi:hypothetical protein
MCSIRVCVYVCVCVCVCVYVQNRRQYVLTQTASPQGFLDHCMEVELRVEPLDRIYQ